MKKHIYSSLMQGISIIVPFLMVASILMISHQFFVSKGIDLPVLSSFLSISQMIYMLIIPILSAVIAYAISDKPAILPGFISGVYIAQYDMGLITAIMLGFISGYLVYVLKDIFKHFHSSLNTLKSMMIIPLLSSIIMIMVAVIFSLFMPFIENEVLLILMPNRMHMIIILAVLSSMLMAYDMGGPINKIVYLFGLISISKGDETMLMASIMVGGMIPPLGIALYGQLFKHRIPDEFHKSVKLNWVYGISFITEGAIPLSHYQKKAVMPSILLGSATGGLVIALFGVKLSLPHGGLFILPFVSQIVGFLLSIIIGMIISTICLFILWKKDDKKSV